MTAAGWIAAEAALARLGVRPQTLYAYVSRGRIQARPDPADPRRSLYSEPDVERLAKRRQVGRRPEAVAASAISWGEPVLRSAISTVHAGRLVYRGLDAVELAETASLEDAAALLWEGEPSLFTEREGADDGADVFAALARLVPAAHPILGRPPERLRLEAAGLLRRTADALSGAAARAGEPIHAQFARAWRAPEAADPLRRALVLLADHELNASTFAVRVTASSGASLPACVLAGLCALSGPLHGSAGLAAAALARDAERDGAGPALRARIAQGLKAVGFGHPLYPGADPRGAALLRSFDPPPTYLALGQAAEEMLGLSPNIDFALAALAARFRFPDDAAFRIFAAARTAGWIAHALEQTMEGRLIRPRARYVGRLPERAEDRDAPG